MTSKQSRPDLTPSMQEIMLQMAAIQAELAELKAHAGAVSTSHPHPQPPEAGGPRISATRRTTLKRLGLALLGGAAAATALGQSPVQAKVVANPQTNGLANRAGMLVLPPGATPPSNNAPAYTYGLIANGDTSSLDLSSLPPGSTGIYGNATFYGVYGNGGYYGVFGNGTEFGVYGNGTAGVYGIGTGMGVYGTGGNYGVSASGTGSGSTGVSGTGVSTGVSGTGGSIGVTGSGSTGVSGTGTGSSSTGVSGTGSTGVSGTGTGTFGSGVLGVNNSGLGIGVSGQGGSYGVYGNGNTGVYGSSTAFGVAGIAGFVGTAGVTASGAYTNNNLTSLNSSVALYANAGYLPTATFGDNQNIGLWVVAGTNSPNPTARTAVAAVFTGPVFVYGTLSKSGGSFKIDHPLEPENKYLYHSFVESPDMMNIYNGEATLTEQGEAVVEMPDWFEALNSDFRYQLTALDSASPNLHVAQRLIDKKFKIGGGQPGQDVSWQVTGIRQDAWAKANRIPVEEDKTGDNKGKYLHPEVHGKSEEFRCM